jgi:hypothetical protein
LGEVVTSKIRAVALWVDWTSCVAVGAGMLLVGCGNPHQGAPECPATLCQTLKDTSAGQLSMLVALNEEASYPSMTSIRIEFQSPQEGKVVGLVAGEHLSCDGVIFTQFPAAFGRDVGTSSIAGRSVKCVYISGQQSTAFAFTVPEQLKILAPGNRERVHRGPRTVITYQGRVTTLSVRASGGNAQVGAVPDSITMTSAVVDTSSMQTGDGFVEITEPCFGIEVEGAAFQSASGYECAAAIVAVVWL